MCCIQLRANSQICVHVRLLVFCKSKYAAIMTLTIIVYENLVVLAVLLFVQFIVS